MAKQNDLSQSIPTGKKKLNRREKFSLSDRSVIIWHFPPSSPQINPGKDYRESLTRLRSEHIYLSCGDVALPRTLIGRFVIVGYIAKIIQGQHDLDTLFRRRSFA